MFIYKKKHLYLIRSCVFKNEIKDKYYNILSTFVKCFKNDTLFKSKTTL